MDELANNEINTSSFSISQINTRSIKRNFDSFRSYLANFKLPPQVLTLSETWLKKGEEVYYNLPNYNFVSLPRENKQGGGVGIYIYYDLPYVIRHDLMNIMKGECEYIVIELILTNNVPILITSLYRPPNTDLNKFNVSFKNFLRIITNDAKRHKKRILIAGDTNIDLLKHINHPGTDDFLNELMAFGFLPSVTRPTRITEVTATLIDNIFTNFPENITSSLIAYDDISDHFPIIVNISLSQVDHKPNIESTLSRTYNKRNFDDFYTKLKSTNWHYISELANSRLNPDDAYNEFYHAFYEIFNKSFPKENQINYCQKSGKLLRPWFTHAIIKSCRKKSRLFKNFKKFPTAVNKIKYNIYKKTLKSCILTAEHMYYQQQFLNSANDIRSTWKVINQIMNNTPVQAKNLSILIDGTISKDSSKIVNKFNEFFINVGPNLAASIPATGKRATDYLTSSNPDSIAIQLADKYEIELIIKQLKNKSSPGLDEIPNNVIKFAAGFISDPLAALINSSISTGIFPNKLKEAKVIPVFKSGDSSLVTNYRPISILNSFSKIFEKIIANRLLKFLDKNNILFSEQFGFRQNHSTCSALISLNEFITSSLDNNEIPVGIFIDLSKAFDSLNHSILLSKLKHLGVRGLPLQLFQNYLSNRSQQVYYNNSLSSSLIITCGVPQGSVLGPLLFLIYIKITFKLKLILRIMTTSTILRYTFSKSFNLLNLLTDQATCALVLDTLRCT